MIDRRYKTKYTIKINHWWFQQATKKTQEKRNQKLQGYIESRGRKTTPDQVTQSKLPRQGKFKVLVWKTAWTYLTPKIKPLR